MSALAPLTLCLALATLVSCRPSEVSTSVRASGSGWTRGRGASVVGAQQGTAAAASIGVARGPGVNLRNERTAGAAITQQGASTGNGDFSQRGVVGAATNGGLGRLGTHTHSFNRGRANNAALTGAQSAAAGATQQLSQAGTLLNNGRPVGRLGSNLNLSTAGGVRSQAGVSGTGSFGQTNTVQTDARHVGALARGGGLGPAGAPGLVLRGAGTPAFNNLRATRPPPMRRMRRMMGRRGGRD